VECGGGAAGSAGGGIQRAEGQAPMVVTREKNLSNKGKSISLQELALGEKRQTAAIIFTGLLIRSPQKKSNFDIKVIVDNQHPCKHILQMYAPPFFFKCAWTMHGRLYPMVTNDQPNILRDIP
jgi:hypothetical protein